MRDTILLEESMVRGNIDGLMEVDILENGKKTK